MSVVCKMKCHAAPVEGEITSATQTIRLGAVYEPDEGKRVKPENAIFGNATPWGELQMGVANPDAKKLFVPGKSYYLTFTEAPD